LPKVLLHCWQLNNLVFSGTFCSTSLSAFVSSPSCSFLKIQKKELKGWSNKLLVLFAFVSMFRFFTTSWYVEVSYYCRYNYRSKQ
jgi:hypothetical protein